MVEQEGAMSEAQAREVWRYEDDLGRRATVEHGPDGKWYLDVRNRRGLNFWSQWFEDGPSARLAMWNRWPRMREVVA